MNDVNCPRPVVLKNFGRISAASHVATHRAKRHWNDATEGAVYESPAIQFVGLLWTRGNDHPT